MVSAEKKSMSIEIEILQKSVTKCLEEWLKVQFLSEMSLVKLLARSRWKQNANMMSEDKTFELERGKLWIFTILDSHKIF